MENEIKKEIQSPKRYHTIFDCSGCNSDTFNKNNITLFGKDVALNLEIEVYGPPAIGHYDNGSKQETGFFHAQILEGLTHICGHYISDERTCYIDLVTRKEPNVDKIQNLINQYFQPQAIQIGFIARYA